jgi:hypothetical protein
MSWIGSQDGLEDHFLVSLNLCRLRLFLELQLVSALTCAGRASSRAPVAAERGEGILGTVDGLV